jgi:sugar phosphate isomerase/epimerase
MRHSIFAMDTSFYHSLGSYEFDVRCEMLQELGYDATYLVLGSEEAWHDTTRLAHVKTQYGLDVAGIYVTLDITAPDDHKENRRILRLVETLEGCTNIEVSLRASDGTLRPSDPSGDEAASRWIKQLLRAAEQRSITISLYPHLSFWLERMDDAVRLCLAIGHPLLRTVFSGFHWYAVKGTDLRQDLQMAAPFLQSVNVCGSRRGMGNDGLIASIEPLDEGELDNFVVLGLLQDLRYQGMIGVQGYSVGGDVYTKLKRSLATLRDMERRLTEHPHWPRLRPGLR